MKWIVIAIVLSLFIVFPKKMFGGLGVLVLAGSAVGGFLYYQDWADKRVVEAVSVSVEYSLGFCDESSPLKITVDNLSDKIVRLVEWNIVAHQVGFSNDLAISGSQIYSQHKVLGPKMHWIGCVSLPKLKRDIEKVSELMFSIKDKDVVFE